MPSTPWPKGGPWRSGRGSRRRKGEAIVEIEDNGNGIDEESLAHVFNPFFTTKKYGTGLGLSQVKKIIDQHRGSIEILSRRGEGTCVVIALPLHRA